MITKCYRATAKNVESAGQVGIITDQGGTIP